MRRNSAAGDRLELARFAPSGRSVLIGLAILVAGLALVEFLGVNFAYQVIRKPSELVFPISGQFYKNPAATWRAYGSRSAV